MFGTLIAQPALLGFKFLLLHLCFITVMADISSRPLVGISLRGARNLQDTGTGTSDTNTVVPRCRPGYKDVTNGLAFMWSCAFHCEGGQYYATTGCACACLTAEQEERWREFGGTTGGVAPAGNVSSARILVTPAPDPTRAPFVPVVAMPIGPTGEEGSEWTWKPPVLENYTQTANQLTTQPPSTEKDNGDPMFHLGVLALLFGGIVVCTAVIGIVCFNWEGIVKRFKKRSKKPKVAEPPVFNLQPHLEKCPQPPVEVSMSSLVSGRTSASSNASRVLEVGSSKVSSKQSGKSAVRSAQKDTRGLLKPPQDPQTQSATASTCSGTWSGTSSVNSQSSWVPPGPPNGRAPPEGHPKRNSRLSSNRLSIGKLSKVQPV
eukprot:s1182_g43.t1